MKYYILILLFTLLGCATTDEEEVFVMTIEFDPNCAQEKLVLFYLLKMKDNYIDTVDYKTTNIYFEQDSVQATINGYTGISNGNAIAYYKSTEELRCNPDTYFPAYIKDYLNGIDKIELISNTTDKENISVNIDTLSAIYFSYDSIYRISKVKEQFYSNVRENDVVYCADYDD